ncbi:hypothetical protein IKG60_00775 [Candidatus Saccharibacteria bacterium]|nr:hypothetical protein [Candidatus Saccharibacteria bacterium]
MEKNIALSLTNSKLFKIPNILGLSLVPLMSLATLTTTIPASAVTYQSTTDQSFTLNPTITLSLTGGNLSIDNLTPGYSSDSNIVTVNVSTNAGYGYYLSATAGTPSTNTNLTHTTATTNTFTNLTSNKPTLSDFSDNTWGYSYCNSANDCTNNANWVSGDLGNTSTGYNGLPLDQNNNGSTGIKLLNPTTIASSGSIQFKIGAKASTTQVAGTYTGTVNFYAVTNPNLPTLADVTYMQDVTSDMVANTAEEMTFTLKDKRDEQEYTVAKLKDGKLWMTKNLNIAGGTTLNCDTTDCDSNYTLPGNQGWAATGKLPESAVKNDNDNNLTDSTQFSQDNYAYVYNSSNVNSGDTITCGGSGQNTPCYSYYSWDAATLGSGRNITTQNTDAPYSICPKGWRLPTSGQDDGTTPETNWKRGDFYHLLTAYGANLESAYYQNTPTFWNDADAGTVANFLLSGSYRGGAFYYGGSSNGYYWSSTSTSSTKSRNLRFDTGVVSSADSGNRRYGYSVRCLISTQQ